MTTKADLGVFLWGATQGYVVSLIDKSQGYDSDYFPRNEIARIGFPLIGFRSDAIDDAYKSASQFAAGQESSLKRGRADLVLANFKVQS